ncbi:MAG TPA: hypothetical protein IAB61_08980 [Candidatus Merdisoma merdipullorum]|nr:hypothetical protein [Candidatus Merdisoma merdipullorum]
MQTNGIKTMQQLHDKISEMNSSYEELKAIERLRKAAEQLARQGRDKSHDGGTVKGTAFWRPLCT